MAITQPRATPQVRGDAARDAMYISRSPGPLASSRLRKRTDLCTVRPGRRWTNRRRMAAQRRTSDVWSPPTWDASVAELVDVWQRSKLVPGTIGRAELRHDLGQDLAHTLVDQRLARCGSEAERHRRAGPAELELVGCLSTNGQ